MKYLVLGGVKSGKSKFAEQTAESLKDKGAATSITMVATAQALDDEMAERITRHQNDRPGHWGVVEEPIALGPLINELADEDSILVIDCLTLWITNLLMLDDQNKLDDEVKRFTEAVRNCSGKLILVSNETNMGIIPIDKLTRRYCDIAGNLHKQLAGLCDSVDLVVAGLPLSLKSTQSNAKH